MSRTKEKIGRVFIALLIFLNLIAPATTNAANYTEYEVKQVVYSNLNQYANVGTMSSTQTSLLSSLGAVSRLYLWVSYMYNVSGEIAKFSDAEKEHYLTILKEKINSFNTTFGEDSEVFKKLTISSPSDSVRVADINTHIVEITNYIRSLYDQHKSFVDAKETDAEKVSYYNDNKLTLDGCYSVMYRFQQDYSFLRTMLPYQDVSSKFTIDTTPISNILNSSSYTFFLDQAQSNLEDSINSAFSLSLSEGDTIIDKFSAVLEDSGEKSEAVNSAYLACVSASSLYMPLESKIGDSMVIEAIDFLCDDDTSVSELYSNIARKKKPLYIRTYSNEKVSGKGQLAVLGDFLELVMSGKSGALATVEGSFQTSDDGNSYEVDDSTYINRVQSGSQTGTYEDGTNADSSTTTDSDSDSTTDNSTTTTTTTNTSKAYEELLDDEGNVTSLESELGEGAPYSSPVLVFGDGAQGETNTLVLTNYYLNKIDLEGELATTGVLYVNPFGDIVLADNTVIMPAASNATFYSDNDNVVYNPFTEMFMEGYPKIGKQTDFNLVSKKDSGKLVITTNKDPNEELTFWGKISTTISNWSYGDNKAYYVSSNGSLKGSVYNSLEVMPIDVGMYNASSSSKDLVFLPEEKSFGTLTGWIDNIVTSSKYLYRMDYTTLTVDGMSSPLFPYGNSEGDEALIRAKYISQSFLYSVIMTEEGASANDNGRLDVNLFYEILCTGLDGKSNVNGFQKLSAEDLLDENSKGVFYKMVKSLIDGCKSLVDLFGDAPGLLGIRSAVQDPVMGKFLYYAKLCMIYIFIGLALVFVANYIRRNLNITYTVAGIAVACLITYASVYFIPRHLSTAANFVFGNKSNQLALESLILRQETNMGTTPEDASYKDFGVFSLSSSSINLYKLSDDEITAICNEYGVDPNKIVGGGAYELDSSYGLFIEGDSLKLNLDKFLYTVTVQGYNDSISNKATYKLTFNKNVSSVVDYYMPYFVIMDGLVDKLNRLSSIYEIPRNQLSYTGSLRKDSFLMDAYIHSPVFLSPTYYKESDESMSDSLLAQLESNSGFGKNNSDFLGLSTSLAEYLEQYEGSLWYETLVQNGYIGDDETCQTKYTNLIEYVNLQTKKFLMDNMEILAYVSDETAIEVTCLYAVMVFNNQVSEFGNVLYPQNLNYSEHTVVDTLRSVVTKDYNKFYTLDRDLVDYTYYEFGWVGVIGVTFSVVCYTLISLTVNYSVYILYLLLIAFTLIRFVMAKKVDEAFKGFLKIFGSLILVYFINVQGTMLIHNFTDSGLSILFLVLLSGLCLGLCIGILSFVVTGFGNLDLGSTKVNAFVSGMKDWKRFFKFGKLGSMNSKDIHAKKIINEDELDYDFTLSRKDRDIVDDAVIEAFLREKYQSQSSGPKYETKRTSYRRRKAPSRDIYMDFDEEDELL